LPIKPESAEGPGQITTVTATTAVA